MSKRWRSKSSKRFESPYIKRRKQIESDIKLINLDETRRRREDKNYNNELFEF